jgi:hypothetical protein
MQGLNSATYRQCYRLTADRAIARAHKYAVGARQQRALLDQGGRDGEKGVLCQGRGEERGVDEQGRRHLDRLRQGPWRRQVEGGPSESR